MTDTTAAQTPETEDMLFGVPFVYCMQHLRAHATGWCTVGADQKIPLAAETIEQAHAEVKAHGWPVFNSADTSYEPRARWSVFGQLIAPSGEIIDDRAHYLA